MTLRVAMAQFDPVVGDIDGNVERILRTWRQAADEGADLVVFTELTVTGYPPEDLLLKPEFVTANLDAVQQLAAKHPRGTAALVGYVGGGGDASDAPHWDVTISARDLHNSVALIAGGEIVGTYNKWRLPNYGVFDEARYFQGDDDPLVVAVGGVPVGVVVCEDLWVERGPVTAAVEAGARVIAALNASPFHRGKRSEREAWARHHARQDGIHVVYVNCVGGQDEVVFDGDSMIVAPDGGTVARGVQFAEDLVVADLDVDPDPDWAGPAVAGIEEDRPDLPARSDAPRLGPVAEVWQALVCGTRSYFHKNGFDRAYVGLSGGIDSAVTAVVAADALGPENVTGVAMPSPHSSEHSLADAEKLAATVGMTYEVVPIEAAMTAVGGMLSGLFAGTEPGVAEENIQARLRGLVLMALSNKFGGLVLATGNKSEMAVGYSTLYGDMAGGFAPLRDVPKTLVYELARFRNDRSPAIPQSTLTKPPSAELRPDQLDEDSLPPYDVLDPILEAYVEDDHSVEAIVEAGFDRDTVERVIRMVDRAEYKRRQAAPGIKITDRAFGRDRRVPITNGWGR